MSTNYSMGFMGYCSHDPTVSIVKNEDGIFSHITAEEGSLSRSKKSYQFPIRALNYCLDYFGISIQEIDIFSIDYMDYKRTYRTSNNYRLLIGDYIRANLNIDSSKIQYIDSHHLAHAFTAFYPSTFDEAAVIIVDGLGSEQQTYSIYKASRDSGINKIFEQKGTGIGSLYTRITTEVLGFGPGEEGKTMGLAPYGENYPEQDKLIPSFKGEFNGMIADYSKQLYRAPESRLKIKLEKCTDSSDIYSPYFTRVAYNLQKETERFLLHIVKETVSKTNCNNVCLAGGVALNAVTNNLIQSLDFVENLFIQPSSGDSGIPLGLALSGMNSIVSTEDWIKSIKNKKNINQLSSMYSSDLKPLQNEMGGNIKEILHKFNVKVNKFNAQELALKISTGDIISFFQNGIEYGPRALGNRSFLADPRSSEMKKKLNKKIKHREGYRPFAPMVLQDKFDLYFSSSTNYHPHMLQTPYCKKITQEKAPAIVHVDNTARVQTLNEENGNSYKVLKQFEKITGVPILINTSFNDNNEPIVLTELDAMCCFSRTNADALVINDIYINRKDISDIVAFTSECEFIQEEICRNYFANAIIKNTNINGETKTSQMINFLKYNNELSLFQKNLYMHNKLIEFILERDSSRVILLDNYHFRLITEIFNMFGGHQKYFPNYEIIEDDMTSLKSIREDSDILLYNISIYFYSEYAIKIFKDIKGLNFFYSRSDKLLKLYDSKLDTDSNSNSNSNSNSDSNAIDTMMDSYEVNKNKSIFEFFNNNI